MNPDIWHGNMAISVKIIGKLAVCFWCYLFLIYIIHFIYTSYIIHIHHTLYISSFHPLLTYNEINIESVLFCTYYITKFVECGFERIIYRVFPFHLSYHLTLNFVIIMLLRNHLAQCGLIQGKLFGNIPSGRN